MASRGPLLIDERPDDAKMLGRTRLRLMAVSGFVTLVILVVLGLVTYGAVSTRFAAADHDQLMAFARERQTEGAAESALELGGSNAGLFTIFISPSGSVSGPTPSTAIPSGLPSQASIQAAQASRSGNDYRSIKAPDGTRYDVYTVTNTTVVIRIAGSPPQVATGWTVQYVANRSAEASLLETLRLILLGGGLLALLAALAAGYLYAGRALVPIRDAIERRRLALQRQREFTANASHELRTPLTVIRTSVEDLRRNRRARVEEVGEALEDIDVEVNHLAALVEDLLLLARTDSGVVQIERRPVDLADSAAEAASLLTPLAQKQDVYVVLDPLPAPLEGDPLRLRQLVTILVDNAIHHSPRDSHVTVQVRGGQREAVLQVEDDGPGIRPEDMPRIFDRFWRADNAPAGGTGLGLAIAKWIVDQHGGTITVANRDEGGARFEVRLPVAPASAAAAGPGQEPASESWLEDLEDASAGPAIRDGNGHSAADPPLDGTSEGVPDGVADERVAPR